MPDAVRCLLALRSSVATYSVSDISYLVNLSKWQYTKQYTTIPHTMSNGNVFFYCIFVFFFLNLNSSARFTKRFECQSNDHMRPKETFTHNNNNKSTNFSNIYSLIWTLTLCTGAYNNLIILMVNAIVFFFTIFFVLSVFPFDHQMFRLLSLSLGRAYVSVGKAWILTAVRTHCGKNCIKCFRVMCFFFTIQ